MKIVDIFVPQTFLMQPILLFMSASFLHLNKISKKDIIHSMLIKQSLLSKALLFICPLLLLSGCGGHSMKKPARLGDTPQVTPPDILGVTYEEYTRIDLSTDSDGDSPWERYMERGQLVAYAYGDRYSYFYEIEGLDEHQWLLEEYQGDNGIVSDGDAVIWKAKGVTEIPEWIQEAKELEAGTD